MHINTDLQKFTKLYLESLSPKENCHYSFILKCSKWGMWVINENCALELDKEDAKYLYDKYSKKVKEEFQKNIDEVTKVYNGVI